MEDNFGRKLTYLRVSVTDRCNLRCQYCMPETGVQLLPHTEILRYTEIVRLVRIMAGQGVSRVRLTGGEPLARRGLARLARQIKEIEGISFLGLTTNAVLLPAAAPALKEAGVDGVNISLDTCDPAQYARLTRRPLLREAQEGLHAALKAGFSSVKINCVLAPQSTQEDWLGVVKLAQNLPVDVRLIEWMPIAGETEQTALSADAALEAIHARFGPLQQLAKHKEGGPAQLWQIEGFKGRLGIIPAISHCFCEDCNRLRLTSTGDLKLCLFYDAGVSLKPLLRGGASDKEITEAILQAVKHKPERHTGSVATCEPHSAGCTIARAGGMYEIGG